MLSSPHKFISDAKLATNPPRRVAEPKPKPKPKPIAEGGYRADVDGIRAIAVISVLLFHLNVAGFSGGYVGVDVFFVISGYLITGIIQGQLAARTFSLKAFYLRRVRRLAPALLAVSVTITFLATVVLYPEDMRSFSSSLALQFLSLQNVAFLLQGEYFRGSDTKLLLHTWTLAVEEQFYLLWPLFLLASHRMHSRAQLLLVTALMAASFALNLALMSISPNAAFYLLPPRAWELGAGGVIALLERRHFFAPWLTETRRVMLGVAGLLITIGSVVVFTSETSFPGLAALVPVTGAVLLIVSGMGGFSAISRSLSHPLLVRVGLISYPLYLWHWPLISVAHHFDLAVARPVVAILIIAASVALAELTYRLLERPIRERQWIPNDRRLITLAGATMLCLCAFGVHAYSTSGAVYRFPANARAFLAAPLAASDDRCGFLFRVMNPTAQACTLHERASPSRRVLLWGNSHADMWSEMLTELGEAQDASVYLNARNCRAVTDSAFCGKQVQDWLLRFLAAKDVTDVVLASTWYGAYGRPDDLFERELAELVGKLSSQGRRIWLVIDAPRAKQFDPIIAYKKSPGAPEVGRLKLVDHRARSDRERLLFTSFQNTYPNIEVIDPSPALCDDTECRAGKGGEVWYRDADHLTLAGARAARRRFEPIFESASVLRR